MVRSINAISRRNLDKINVLVTDPDVRMGNVLVQMLRKFGFGHIHYAKEGGAAIDILGEHEIDILITDWQMQPLDGIFLISNVRRGDDSNNRMMPIIMLTARAESQDVEFARDAGINEFIVKPYTTKTVFTKLQQVIDNPRNFILSPSYVGPERRRKEGPPAGMQDRRKQVPKRIPANKAKLSDDYYTPRIVATRNTLKEKMGLSLTDSITRIITPELLEQAQKEIEQLHDESLQWIKVELDSLERLYTKLNAAHNSLTHDQIMEELLILKGRSGTFGLPLLSRAAQMIYKFLRMTYKIGNPQNADVNRIHINALKVLFAEDVKKGDGKDGEELLSQMQALIDKYPDI